ncbi:MAG: chitobiase/beta-hexosaminidase C-terminal domain-containing protein, partial [Armatimonadota bacterium]
MILSVVGLYAANMVTDPSLESYTVGTVKTTDFQLGDWLFTASSGSGGRLEVVSTAQSGSKAIKLSRTSTSGDPAFGNWHTSDHSHQIPVVGGHRYVVRVWAMSPDGATMKFQVASFNDGTTNGGWLGDTIYADNLATQTKWTVYQMTYTAPSNALYAGLAVRVKNANTNLYIDSFSLEDVTAMTGNLYPDPSFDSFIAGNTYTTGSYIGMFNFFSTVAGNGALSVITPGQDGDTAIRLSRLTTSGDTGFGLQTTYIDPRIPVIAGHTYRVSFWARSDVSSDMQWTISSYPVTGSATYTNYTYTPSAAWTQYSGTYTALSDAVLWNIGFRSIAVRSVDIDNMSITDVTPSTLTGTVANSQTGSAISNATVSITPVSGGTTLSTTTNASGVYTFSGLSPADYNLTASASGYVTYSASAITVLGTVTKNVSVTSNADVWNINYSSFTSTTGLNLMNSASLYNSYLRLCTDYADGSSSTGSSAQAWTTNKYATSAGFITEFQFKIVNTTGSTADGFVFAVQNAGSSAYGWASGPSNSVCLRFDTFQNTGEPSNGYMAVYASSTGDLARVDLKSLGINIADGSLHTARIEYGSGFMNVYFDGTLRISKLPINISNYSAVDASGNSYLGFSAGTGGAAETNYIASWKFKSGYQMPAETPVFTPDGGSYATSKNVTVTCETTGAEIHYTTDGSTPTASSPVYSAPVSMSNGTLKAIAFAPGFTSSQIKTATYTLSGSVTNIGDVKSIANNTHVAFSGIVTGAFADGMVFVENENRTCG